MILRTGFLAGRVLRISFLTAAIVGWAFDTMELILLPFDLNPCSGQGILLGGTVELCQLFVKLTIREKSLSEGIDGSLLMAERDSHLLSIEPANVVAKWLAKMLLDAI